MYYYLALALLALLLRLRIVGEARRRGGAARLAANRFATARSHARIGVERFGHFLTDNIDEPLEDRLHVDVLFCRGLEKLEAC